MKQKINWQHACNLLKEWSITENDQVLKSWKSVESRLIYDKYYIGKDVSTKNSLCINEKRSSYSENWI